MHRVSVMTYVKWMADSPPYMFIVRTQTLFIEILNIPS